VKERAEPTISSGSQPPIKLEQQLGLGRQMTVGLRDMGHFTVGESDVLLPAAQQKKRGLVPRLHSLLYETRTADEKIALGAQAMS